MSSIHVHSERSARTGIAIVWPCWFPGSVDPELHATALFLGNTDTVDFTKEEVEEALGRYLWPAWTQSKGFSLFGANHDIPVLVLEHTNLLTITRDDIKRRLFNRGIRANDQFDFIPHVTVAKEIAGGAYRPSEVHLESPVLWWGDERVLHTEHAKQKAKAA